MDDEMNKLSREAIARLEKVNDNERRQLGFILTMLADCYGEDASAKAVITFRRGEGALGIMGINTSEMDTAEMLHYSAAIMNHAVTIDAPPKEMFN